MLKEFVKNFRNKKKNLFELLAELIKTTFKLVKENKYLKSNKVV
jgi:hypothetical protein